MKKRGGFAVIVISELSDGLIQVTHQGLWDAATWTEIDQCVQQQMATHASPIYVVFNLTLTVEVETDAFLDFLTSPLFERLGLAVLVARRAHLRLSRELLAHHPDRDRVQLRLMSNQADAFRALLDRQAMARLNHYSATNSVVR